MNFEVDLVNEENVLNNLNELNDLHKNKKVLSAIGVAWIATVKSNFKKSMSPNGKKWARINHRNGKPLMDTGRLVGSFTSSVNGDYLTVGTPLIYAKTHNEGLRSVTKREFMPSKKDYTGSDFEKAAINVVNLYIKKFS